MITVSSTWTIVSGVMMMSYKIWIGCTINGLAIVGAKNINSFVDLGYINDSEQIYGSQMRYRVVVYDSTQPLSGPYRIMTRTQANKEGHVIVDDFARYARRR